MADTVVGIFSKCQLRTRKTLQSENFPNQSTIRAMAYDVQKRRAALARFLKSTGLSEFRVEKAGGIGQGTIGKFLKGHTQSMTDETWTLIAVGAGEALARPVTVAEVQGDKLKTVPITSRIGAGERVFPVQIDLPIGYADPPPGVETSEAWQVDGESMRPLYGPRDLLFPGKHRRDPGTLVGRIVAAQIANDGPRVVKLLRRGSQRRRWDLISVNPAHPTMEDQELEWVAMIAAAIYAP